MRDCDNQDYELQKLTIKNINDSVKACNELGIDLLKGMPIPEKCKNLNFWYHKERMAKMKRELKIKD